MAGNVRDSARGLRRSRRREALINLARESNPTRESGGGRDGRRRSPRRKRESAGGRGGGGRRRETEDATVRSFAATIGGETGDRERRRLSRKFGNYRCRVVVLFLSSSVFFFFLLFFSPSDIDLGEAVRIRGTSVPCDSRRRCRRQPARCITAQRALRGTRRCRE